MFKKLEFFIYQDKSESPESKAYALPIFYEMGSLIITLYEKRAYSCPNFFLKKFTVLKKIPIRNKYNLN